jgi:hypothetical protein
VDVKCSPDETLVSQENLFPALGLFHLHILDLIQLRQGSKLKDLGE